MWVPDVYHGAPTPVTLFIGSAPKIALVRAGVSALLAEGLGATACASWQDMLIALAVLSMAIGNVVAIAQTNLKRMLAYSTISHVGFILLGILAGTSDGYAAAMFYTITYVIMAIGAFGMILLLSRAGFEADELEDFKGLNARSPWFAAVMMMLMFSMAGVPPFVGFWAKLAVIQAVLDVGLAWLADRGGRVLGDRRLLLPARRQAHVLRRADRDRGASRAAAGIAFRAERERPRRARARHVPGVAARALRDRDSVIRTGERGSRRWRRLTLNHRPRSRLSRV